MTALVSIVALRSSSETVAVRYTEGSSSGLLTLRTLDGIPLASGELVQNLRRGKIYSRLTFRFKDGSIDDDSSIYSQNSTLRLLHDHHVQHGRSFPHPLDMTIDAPTGTITVRSKTENGEDQTKTHHLDLPEDVANGCILSIIRNLPPSGEAKISLVASDSKPRLVQLEISPEGKDVFFIAGQRHKARRYSMKVKLGGLPGVIAPLIGREPAEIHVWTTEGNPPALLKIETQLYDQGPVWSIEVASPFWRQQKRATP